MSAPAHDALLPAAPPRLMMLAGLQEVVFLLRFDDTLKVLCVRACRFLEGLLAASAALSFGELLRDESPLEELLPWAGNV